MKKDTICIHCGKSIGQFNEIDKGVAIKKHFKNFHPVVYSDLMERTQEIRDLLQEFRDISGGVSYKLFMAD